MLRTSAALRIGALVLMALAAACGAFAYWGLATVAGQRAFDEMDGLIPFGAGCLGGVLAVAALLAWYLAQRDTS